MGVVPVSTLPAAPPQNQSPLSGGSEMPAGTCAGAGETEAWPSPTAQHIRGKPRWEPVFLDSCQPHCPPRVLRGQSQSSHRSDLLCSGP